MLSACVVLCLLALASGQRYATESKLRHDLLDSYDKYVLPVSQEGKPIQVKFGTTLLRAEIDEPTAVLRTDIFALISFTDPRFMWNPEEYDNIDQLAVPSTDIWLPDITHYWDTSSSTGSKQINAAFGSNVHALIYPNGTVIYVPSYTILTPCKLDYTQWPKDSQFCSSKFGSWVHANDEIAMELSDNMGAMFDGFRVPSLTWDLVDVRAKKSTEVYFGKGYDSVEIKMEFGRKDVFCSTLYGPIFLSIIISLLAFLEPSGKPVKHLMFIFNIFFMASVVFFHVGQGVQGKPKMFCFMYGFMFLQLLVVLGDHLIKMMHCGRKMVRMMVHKMSRGKYAMQSDDSMSDNAVVVKEKNSVKPISTMLMQGVLFGLHVVAIGFLYIHAWPERHITIHNPSY